jgi:hypothetical protein
VGTPVAALEHPGNEDFIVAQVSAADRAASAAGPFQTVPAAPDVHNADLAAGKGGKREGFYQFSLVQPGGANRADLGVAGRGGFPDKARPLCAHARTCAVSRQLPDYQGITEPEQHDADGNKNQYL